MKASDEILGIAEQIFIDIGNGKSILLPEGWEISQINTANKTMTILIPTDFDTIDTKSKKEKEIPFTILKEFFEAYYAYLKFLLEVAITCALLLLPFAFLICIGIWIINHL
jgi:hypothetical protein